MRPHEAIGSHNSHLYSVAFTPLSIGVFALIDTLSLSPPEPPRDKPKSENTSVHAPRPTATLEEARAQMRSEFANSQRFRRRCRQSVN
jgi:hypothetical protein